MQAFTGCIAGALTAPSSNRSSPGRLRGHRDPGDPPRASLGRVGDHPRPQACLRIRQRLTAPASGRCVPDHACRATASVSMKSWAWVGTLGVVTIVAYGVAYYSFGALIDPIKHSTGWSTTALGATFSAVLVIGGVGGLFGGRLVDRLGTRPAFLIPGTIGASAIAARLNVRRRPGVRRAIRGRCRCDLRARVLPRHPANRDPCLTRSAAARSGQVDDIGGVRQPDLPAPHGMAQ